MMRQLPGEGLSSSDPRASQEIHRGRRYVVSRVWTAEGASLVLKQVRRSPFASSSLAMLHHEFALLRELRDSGVPGVVRPLALEEVADTPTLVLEDAGPYDLREWLRRNPLDLDTFLELALQLAESLEGLHRHHVIHRNFNPTNIIVAAGVPLVTVIDFDLATRVPGPFHSTSTIGEFELSLSYIAPEQTGRMDRLVDHRADLYSLGATFYEMLTGQPPFTSTDLAELVHAHLARPPLPPVLANPQIPALLSDLVLKLLAKMPDERYQSAEALLSDLLEARRRQRTTGELEPFELGGLEQAQQLALPERLYGRERELAQLEAALARVRSGPSETVVLLGPAGIGKSALVHALRQRTGHEARFLSGKVDRLQRNVPYAPWVDAFQGLVPGLLNEPAHIRHMWRRRLLKALGHHGRVLLGIIPELEQLTGVLPPMAELRPAEAENRLHLTFQALVRALSSPEHPSVLFLDDLQWADPASIALFRSLASDLDARHVLLVGAYCPEDVGPQHPLAAPLAAIQEVGAPLRLLELSPLTPEALTAFLRDTLRHEPGHLRPLAELILRKTAGNPFFVSRLLRYLHQANLLRFDVERGAWVWELTGVEQVDVRGSVIELMLATLRQLPARTQDVLKVAACLGNRVALPLLSDLMDMPVGDTAAALWSALQQGLLVPEGKAVYRFAHDRVQQAAYSLLSDDQKKRLHLEAGHRLRGTSERELDERLFETVDQLDLGAELVTDDEGKLELAKLNLRAGSKAKALSAFRSAQGYLARGIDFLPQDAWQSHYELTFRLHREAAECAYFTGEQQFIEQLLSSALTHARSRFDKAGLYTLLILAYTVKRAVSEAIQWGREGLRLFGVELPEKHDAPQALRDELAAVKENLRGRTPEQLLEAPRTEDPELLACLQLLTELSPSVFFCDPSLFSFLNARVVNLTLKHGNTVYAASSYTYYGQMLELLEGDYASGHAFGRLGVELCRRYAEPRQESKTLLTFAANINHWRAPLRTDVPFYLQSFATALACGDLHFASYTVPMTAHTQFSMGTGLSHLLSGLEPGLAFLRRSGFLELVNPLLGLRHVIRCLQDRTRERSRVEDDAFDEAAFFASIQKQPVTRCTYRLLRLQMSYLLGDLEEAWKMSREAHPLLEAIQGWYFVADHNFYTSLLLAASCDRVPPPERSALLEQLAANQRQLNLWAENCPENFRHKHQLVSAELARVEGRHVEALRLYEQAAEGAHREEFLQDEALANELAGRYYLTVGGKRLAHVYLRAALEGYARWGAQAKVSALEEEFPDLVPLEPTFWKAPPFNPESAGSGGGTLDLITLLKSAETLVSEVVLERLLEKLMAVCLEAAGAQRGALVLEEQDTLWVRAVGAVSEPVSLLHTPLKESGQVPGTLIEYAFRTGESLVLADAAHQGRFTSDPYVARHAMKSALTVPIQRPSRTVGVLYLENNLVTRAFTPDRVRVLRLLSSQIAISLENSLLFEQLRVEVEERRRAEQAVRFLAEWSLMLAESLDYEATLDKVARSVVPFLADWCIIDVVQNDGTIRPVAMTHVDPAKEQLLRELMEMAPPTWDSPTPLAHVLKTGQPLLFEQVDDEFVRETNTGREERFFDIVRTLSLRSGMMVPLVARGKMLGAIVFVSMTTGRHYGEADLNLAQELARRAAVCIDNARLYRESQEAIQLRDDFLSVAAHELYTPITSLRLSVQGLLRRSGSNLPQPLTRCIQSAESQTRRLAKLVEELLDVTRIQAGRLHLHLEQVELATVVRDVTKRLSESLTRAHCPLSLQLQEGVVGWWDRTRLEQVITNLLSNALKFAADKPIDISIEQDAGLARMRVSDQGIGIAPDRLPYVFERFERAVPVDHYGGLGLGLHIVREIVTALGGEVRVESEPGVGTTFTVELPCQGPSTAPSAHPTPPSCAGTA